LQGKIFWGVFRSKRNSTSFDDGVFNSWYLHVALRGGGKNLRTEVQGDPESEKRFPRRRGEKNPAKVLLRRPETPEKRMIQKKKWGSVRGASALTSRVFNNV